MMEAVAQMIILAIILVCWSKLDVNGPGAQQIIGTVSISH